MAKQRKLIPKKNLGSFRIDLPLPKKKEFIKRIIKYKEPYKSINADYRKLQVGDKKGQFNKKKSHSPS